MVYFKNLNWRCTGVNIAVISVESPINDTMKKYIIFNEIAKSFRTSFLQNTSLVAVSLIWFLLLSNFWNSLLKFLKAHRWPVVCGHYNLQSLKFDKFDKHMNMSWHGSSWTHCSFVFIHLRPVFHSYGN